MALTRFAKRRKEPHSNSSLSRRRNRRASSWWSYRRQAKLSRIKLVYCTGRLIRHRKASISAELAGIFEQLNLERPALAEPDREALR